jgi:hypothetical protein
MKRLFVWFARLFGRAPVVMVAVVDAPEGPTPMPAVEVLPAVEVPPVAALEPEAAALPGEDGQWYFKRGILDELDRYMGYLKRMRRADGEAYGLYSKIGGHMIPPETLVALGGRLSPWFLKTLPGFGCVAVAMGKVEHEDEKKANRVGARFMYFTRYKGSPWFAQRSNVAAVVYKVTIHWDREDFSAPFQQDYVVAVQPDGEIEPLRVLKQEAQRISHRRGEGKARKGSNYSVVHHQRWGIPDGFVEWAADRKVEPSVLMKRVFTGMMNWFEMANSSMIRISASKNGLSAVFGVDVTRTPYFFRDRDPVVSPDGKKRRIFHVARTHMRTLPDGRVRGVKMHFRGLRQFTWNGYDILITVPNWHHANLAEWGAEALDEQDWDGVGDMMDQPQMGERLARHIHTGQHSTLLH